MAGAVAGESGLGGWGAGLAPRIPAIWWWSWTWDQSSLAGCRGGQEVEPLSFGKHAALRALPSGSRPYGLLPRRGRSRPP